MTRLHQSSLRVSVSTPRPEQSEKRDHELANPRRYNKRSNTIEQRKREDEIQQVEFTTESAAETKQQASAGFGRSDACANLKVSEFLPLLTIVIIGLDKLLQKIPGKRINMTFRRTPRHVQSQFLDTNDHRYAISTRRCVGNSTAWKFTMGLNQRELTPRHPYPPAMIVIAK